ncbi:adhesion G-protein coupled receptor G4-like [Leptodactylus fuscus]|uniref:adhesion G-protein coupled receptor G4-like n=1 Tax=Leptodactylus fuscus TaxID=238119 RepID=UPI003F4E9C94
MNGELYNYQMWNYARSQEELLYCNEGNLISWTKVDWIFKRILEDVTLRCANATVTPTPIANTSTTTTTLGQTTTTRITTPAPENSASTVNQTSVTPTPGILSTSSTEKETTNSISTNYTTSTQLPDTLPTSPPVDSGLSTQVSTTESLLGDNLLTNSSIKLPTGNNVTGNTSSTYHSPPELRTTSAVPILSSKNTTTMTATVQHQSTGAKNTADPQSGKTSQPVNGTTSKVLLTSPTTKSITPSEVTVMSSTSSSSSSTTDKSSSGNYSSTSAGIAISSRPLTTPNVTISGVTVSTISYSETVYITSATINKPIMVSYFVARIDFTIPSTEEIDEDEVSLLIKSLMDNLLNNTEFVTVQIIVTVSSSGYTAKSIVRVNSSKDEDFLADELKNCLIEGLRDQQLIPSLIAKNVTTEELDEHCTNGSTTYDGFWYEWPETNPTEKATLKCHTDLNEIATRVCYINVTTLIAEWGPPNYSKCVPTTFEDLENINVTLENANYLAKQILNMTKNATSLPKKDITIILNKISEILALGEIDLENTKIHMDVINFILLKGDTSSLHLFASTILNLLEDVGFKMNFPNDMANVTADSMALLVSKKFNDMSFAVTTYFEGNVEITLGQVPPDKVVALIQLPRSIQEQAKISSTKVQFNFIGSELPFQDFQSKDLILNTYIISARFEGAPNIQNLTEPVNITLRHLMENVDNWPVECAFWDFSKNNDMGGWNPSGCKKTFTNKEYTSCSCNHLTHFGVLLDISRTQIDPFNERILSLLTYVGCGIASLFLGLALVTYGMFRQLRRDYPSKILMNLSFSLLMLNLLFLVNNWLSSFRNQGLCVSAAVLLHYFLLSSFTWMGLEAVHMYFAFVKVFNSYIHKYILKLCIAGWGIPLVVVVIVLCIDVDFYGIVPDEKTAIPGDNDSLFCWIRDDTVFYVSVVSYFGAVFLNNISMFIIVLLQIKSLKATKIKDWKALFLHDIKNTLSLAFLLGLTWGFAFFAWGPVHTAFLYLFAIFNTLQGFFIFVFHCLIKENVRRHWRMYLCCGSCRLDNYSDWSRLSNADTRYNGRIHLSPSDSYQSTRSNNTASTSNASSLSSLSRDPFYGRSISGGGIFINSAHTAPSNHATVYPNRRISTLLD